MRLGPAIRCVTFDTFLAPPGESVHRGFAGEGTARLPGTVQLAEGELLVRLLALPQVRALCWEELGLPVDAPYRLRVGAPFITDPNIKPGDIDVLIALPASRYRAVALEAKRVKIRPGSQGSETISKVQGIAEGIRQVNALAAMRFSQTYLAILVISDVRRPALENFLCQQPSRTRLGEILDAVDWEPLAETVGLLWVEIPQGADRPLEEAGMVCVGVLRRAVPVEQSSDLTNGVARFMTLNT